MYKLLILYVVVVMAACNSKAPGNESSSSSNAAKASYSAWSREDEMEFLDACVAGSSEKLGEETAFDKCKCILRKIQAENPRNDSMVTERMMQDTERMSRLAAECN